MNRSALRALAAGAAATLLAACASAPAPVATAKPAASKAPWWLGEKTRITWAVDYQGSRYDLLLTLRATDPEVRFDWMMTPPAAVSGSRTLLAEDLASSHAQTNFFQDGESGAKPGTLTIWLSRAMLDELHATGATKATIDGAEVTLTKGEGGIRDIRIGEKDHVLRFVTLTSDQGHRIVVNDDPAAPFILEQHIGFDVELKSIEPAPPAG